MDNPEISKALQLVEESAFTREQLIGYDMFWDRVSRDKTMANDLRQSKKQLKEAFIQLDKTTNMLKETTNKLYTSARKMKAKGFAIKDIAEITGLSIEEIKML